MVFMTRLRTASVGVVCFLFLALLAWSIHPIEMSGAQDGEAEEEFKWRELGAEVYSRSCASCHQDDGKGIPGAFPALAGNNYVQSQPNQVVRTIYNGRGGMPSFRGDLSVEKIAAVISYIRNTWGNTAEPLEPDDVKAVIEKALLFKVKDNVKSIVTALNEKTVPGSLRQAFAEADIDLPENVPVDKVDSNEWLIGESYKARRFGTQLSVYDRLSNSGH